MNTVKVCDAIMGSGKTQSTISLINQNPERRFIYLSPYLDEARRIRNGCPQANFVEPSSKIPTFEFSKIEHTKHLLREGCNIASSHVAFKMYTPDMIESIKNGHYTLIIDEALDVFQKSSFGDGDVQMLINGGYLKDDNGTLSCTGKPYTGTRLADIFGMLQCHNLVRTVDRTGTNGTYYYWTLPREILLAFSEVYVLTYLFECQDFKYFLDMNKIPYSYIGIHRDGDNYNFTDDPEYIPPYVEHLSDMIIIHDSPKMNSVGNNKHALSGNWMRKNTNGCETLRKNLHNYFQNLCKSRSQDIMWATFNDSVKDLRGKGYSKQVTQFNLKATNEYRNRTSLAYCANVFTQPEKKAFFANNGIEYDEDGYATSTIVQWIWRSAIRDGKKVNVYVPSKRMRSLLKEWICKTQQNYINLNKENKEK